jgi:hypothetical protein
MRNYLVILLLLFTTSCGIFGGGKSSGEDEEKKKKKKPKKCKLEACHVRMMHMHEGAEYYGKKKWFLRPFFFCNKNPKIGQGIKPEKTKKPK